MAYEVLEPEAELPGYEVIEPEQAEASRVKNDYIAKGGNPRDVLSPERQKVFDEEVKRQEAQGATPQQAVVAASKAVDQIPPTTRPDGSISAGFKPTEQAKAEGIIEPKALPAVEAAQARGVTTVSSGTTPQGGGLAVGKDQAGNTAKVETDQDGNPLPGYEVVEDDQPSRLGAVARTVASEFIPTTIGGLAARAGTLVPGPLPAKLGAGLVAGAAGYIGGRALQEQAGQMVLGPERMQRINEILQKDKEAFPASTFAASVLTPTIGGVAGLGQKGVQAIRGLGQKATTEVAEQAPKVAEEVAKGVVKETSETPIASMPKPGPGEGQRALPKRVVEDPATAPAVAKAISEGDVLYAKQGYKRPQEAIEELALKDQQALADQQDFTGLVAKAVIVKNAVNSGDFKLARQYMDKLAPKGTEMAQGLNAFKIIQTSPAGYVFALDDLVAKRGYQLTDDLRRKATNLFRARGASQGRFNNLAAKARETLDNADIAKAVKAEKVYLERIYQLDNFESRLVPKRLLGETIPTVLQGNLLTPLSVFVNLWGNAVNSLPRAIGRQVAFFGQEIGRAANRIRGVKNAAREIKSPLGLGTPERILASLTGLSRGFGEGVVGLRRGINAEGLLAGEKIRGFQPLQAWRDLWRSQNLAKAIKPSLSQAATDKLRLLVEGTLGVPAETMLRLLQLGDAPFRRLAQARLLTEAGQLAGKSAKATRVAARFPEERAISKIEQEAAQAVYQQDSALSRAAMTAANLFGAGNKSGLARTIGKTIIPYAKTPANVVDELLEFSLPMYAPLKAYKSNAGARAVNMAWGKTLTGMTIGAIGLFLSRKGVIGGKPSDSEKQRDLQYQTLAPRSVNISAINRMIDEGGDVLSDDSEVSTEPGDKILSLEKLGIVGAILSVTQAMRDAGQAPPEDAAFSYASLFPETLSFAFNQSFLKGTNSLLSAMLDGDGAKLDKWVTDYFGTIASVGLPNSLSAISRANRELMPDKIQLKDLEGDFAEKTFSLFSEIVKRRVPGAGDDLATRVDLWGRDVPQTPEGADPFAYNFLDVTKGREVAYDKITLGVYELFKQTDDGDVVPPKPGRNFTLNNKTYRLDPDLYETYARARGRANRQAAEQIFKDPAFRRMTNADKVKVLKRAYAVAGDDARDAFAQRYETRIRLGQPQ